MKEIKVAKGNGSITVEAAIAVPVFICAIITIAYILKIVFIHELIQNAISEAANEIASCSYIYSASGIKDIHDSASKGLEEGGEKAREQLGILVNAYDCFKSFPEKADEKLKNGEENLNLVNVDGTIDDMSELAQSVDELGQKLSDSEKVLKEIKSNPKEEIKYFACLFAKKGFETAKTKMLLEPLVKALMIKHIKIDGTSIDNRLKSLNISGGLDGLDFSDSRLFEDGENIDIVVKYKIKPMIPIKIVPEIPITQRVTVRGWMNGEKDSTEDIWALGNLERGRRIQEIFGRNLPNNFKAITKFENGTATIVTSINLNASTYKNRPRIVLSEVKKAIRDIKSFEKDRKTIDDNGKTIEYYITKSDIRYRKVIVVIPKNSNNSEYQKLFKECEKIAQKSGVELYVEEL